MNIESYQRLFPTKLRPEVEFAGKFLESKGLRLGFEFGPSNAVDKAADLMLLSEYIGTGK